MTERAIKEIALRNIGLAVSIAQAHGSRDDAKRNAIIQNNRAEDIIAGLLDTLWLTTKILEPESGISLEEMLHRIWETSQGTQGLTPDQVINGTNG